MSGMGNGLVSAKLKKLIQPIPSQKDGNRRRLKTPTVSVSAIVGKNGDGKSSLVELMLRIINNYGYACQDQGTVL